MEYTDWTVLVQDGGKWYEKSNQVCINEMEIEMEAVKISKRLSGYDAQWNYGYWFTNK